MKELIGTGYRSNSYLVDNKYIYLEGKNIESLASYENDYNTLKFINNRIKVVQIPNNLKLIREGNGTLIYDKIEGNIYNKDYNYNKNISTKLGLFLNELHDIKVEYNYKEIINKDLKEIESNLNNIKDYIDIEHYNKLLIFYKNYKNYIKNHHKLYLTHGDLWYGNYIIKDDDLNGIIDFENSKIFYKEYDLAPLLYINKEFLINVLKVYKRKVKLENIYMFMVRRELLFFNYVNLYYKDRLDYQLNKMYRYIDLYIK